MKNNTMKNNTMKTLVGMSLLMGGLGMHANAAIVYEGFDFTGDIVGGGSGNGWDGDWLGDDDNAAGTPAVGAGLTYTGLTTTGGSYSRPARNGVAQSSRVLSTTSQTALTMNGTTVYFSVLMDSNNGGNGFATNSNGALVFGDTAFTLDNPGTTPPTIGTGGNALGVTFEGPDGIYDNVNAHAITYVNGTRTLSGTNDNIGDDTVMIVGRIDWAANGSDDTLSLYNVTDTTAALGTAFATMTADLDQSTFNMIAIGQGQTEVFDEIRFDTTLAGVGISPIPEPSSTALLGLGGIALLLRRRK
ncbi:MAG: PEP-CTERM sorting domain-containing protein [Akkermansiaceae bacterium]